MTTTTLADGGGVQDIGRVFIVGAGTMGREIALQCARHGVRIALFDAVPAALEQASARLRAAAEYLAANGLLEGRDLPATLQRVEIVPNWSGLADADLAIECVPENLELKKQIFAQMSDHCRADAILVTNTSSLVPSQLASSCRNPARLAAFHFHLPVAICNIVDVMPHPGTAPSVVESLDRFARKIGQIPIRYGREHHAYIFNSIFGAMQRQALDLVIDGVAAFEDVDRSWMGIFKMPVGPFGMFDNIGLDTIAEILRHWAETLNDDAGRRRVAFLRQ